MSRFTFGRFLLCLGVFLFTCQTAALAQDGGDPPTTDPPDAVEEEDGLAGVKIRQVDPKARTTRLREDARRRMGRQAPASELMYVSIPQALREAERLQAAGKPLPNRLRYLGGMTRIQYVFLFPEKNDIVIAGLHESIGNADSLRPTGKTSGRPVLHLEDLIVSLQTFGPTGTQKSIAVSIDPPAGKVEEAQKVVREFGPLRTRKDRALLGEKLAEAMGDQPVRFLGTPKASRLALVMLEADYQMKRLAMGIDPSPVASVRYPPSTTARANSWWFVTALQTPLRVTPDGKGYALPHQVIQLNAGNKFGPQNAPTAAHKRYADQFTKHYPQMAAAIPSFADMENVAHLMLVSALIRHDKLHEEVKWDIAKDLQNLKTPRHIAPKTAATLAHHNGRGFAIGGVRFQWQSLAANASADAPPVRVTTEDSDDIHIWAKEDRHKPEFAYTTRR